jgi:hypothetical protein
MLPQIGDKNCHFWLKYGEFAKFSPFWRSLEFHAQIAGNGISRVLILKIFQGACTRTP